MTRITISEKENGLQLKFKIYLNICMIFWYINKAFQSNNVLNHIIHMMVFFFSFFLTNKQTSLNSTGASGTLLVPFTVARDCKNSTDNQFSLEAPSDPILENCPTTGHLEACSFTGPFSFSSFRSFMWPNQCFLSAMCLPGTEPTMKTLEERYLFIRFLIQWSNEKDRRSSDKF